MDASSVDDLAAGGNFRLDTDLGPLDVMQWVAGIDVDNLYAELATVGIGLHLGRRTASLLRHRASARDEAGGGPPT